MVTVGTSWVVAEKVRRSSLKLVTVLVTV